MPACTRGFALTWVDTRCAAFSLRATPLGQSALSGCRDTGSGMMPGMDVNADARFPGSRFPVVIIGEVVWLRYRFNLSLRDIPALVARSGNVVSHETVRQWCETFGPDYAKQVRRRRPRPGDKWHLDEMVIRMNGVQHYLRRAVDQRGTCLGPQGTPPPAARRTRPDPVQPTRDSAPPDPLHRCLRGRGHARDDPPRGHDREVVTPRSKASSSSVSRMPGPRATTA